VNNRSTIHIVGSGIVGAATGIAFQELGHDVHFVDANPVRVQELAAEGLKATETLELSASLDSFIIVCVSTPSTEAGYDLSQVRCALASIGAKIRETTGFHIVVMRSTVPPLTWVRVTIPALEAATGRSVGDGYEVASVPEFLRQATALEDSRSPRVTVIAAQDEQVRLKLTNLYSAFNGAIRSFDDPTVAETAKLANNCFNAAKISFANEIWKICTHLGIAQEQVAEVVAESAEGSYNKAYGILGGYPFGGACLPKDLDGFLGFGIESGLDLPLLTAVRTVNESTAPQASSDMVSKLDEVTG
jgi:UDPglucose 6-dehydrogenase